MIDGMRQSGNEQQGEEEISQRKAKLIAQFQEYMHVTCNELSLASEEQTEALRTPLLHMQCTEEEVSDWERFAALLPRLLHSARLLHTTIGHLLQRAEGEELLDAHERAVWHHFLRNPAIGFQEKERGIEELREELSLRQRQKTGEEQSPRDEREKRPLEQDSRTRAPEEGQKKPQKKLVQQRISTVEEEPQIEKKSAPHTEESPSPLQTIRTHTRGLLTLLPSSLVPLYTTAANRGSSALQAVHTTIEQSLFRQSMGLRHHRGTVILTQEHLQSSKGALDACTTCALQGEEAPTVILASLPLSTQSGVVHGIHQDLLQNLRTLERHGMCLRTLIGIGITVTLLTGCTLQKSMEDDPLENPLYAKRYYDELLENLVSLTLHKDPILQKKGKEKMIEHARRDALVQAREAEKRQRDTQQGGFIPIEEYARGKALLTTTTLYLSPDFEVTPGLSLHLFLTTTVDPRDGEFPDHNAIDVGPLLRTYGAQAFPVTLPQDPILYRTAVIWDTALERLVSFAQLSK